MKKYLSDLCDLSNCRKKIIEFGPRLEIKGNANYLPKKNNI